MKAPVSVLAVDLGAESGRARRFEFDGTRIVAAEQIRFANETVREQGALRWSLRTLWSDIAVAVGRLDATSGGTVSTVGVDSWGLDSVLLDEHGDAIEEPVCYRDSRQLRGRRRAIDLVGSRRLHDATGAHLLAGNAIFGWTDIASRAPGFDGVRGIGMVADHLHHRLCGTRVSEESIASTSGAIDMRTRDWARSLLSDLGIPPRILPDLVPAGTDLGPLDRVDGIRHGIRVVTPASHDTASAVLGTPAMDDRSVFISSGTWSLVGLVRPEAVISGATFAAGLTNEVTSPGVVRVLQNVMGLWLLQRCRREWAAQGHEYEYEELVHAASEAPILASVFDANDASLFAPDDMLGSIRSLVARAGTAVPHSVGEVVRSVIDSLAVSYRLAIDALVDATGQRPDAIRVSGGGSRNAALLQATSDATGLPVFAGPAEATALGNAAMQLSGIGELHTCGDLDAVVAASTHTVLYAPRHSDQWEAAVRRIADLRARTSMTAGTPAGG